MAERHEDYTTFDKIPPQIAERLAAASAAAAAVPKGSHNDFASYDYASAEQIISHVRPLLTAHGLGIYRLGWAAVRWTITHDGEPCTKVRVHFQVSALGTDVAWCTQVYWPVVTSKGRPADKAEASALTDATKYWLLGLLMLPRADIEMDQRPDSVSTMPAKKGAKSGKPTI